MPTLLSVGDQLRCWRIVQYLNQSNAVNYEAVFAPAPDPDENKRQIGKLFPHGIPAGFDLLHDRVFLKQFSDPGYSHYELLVAFAEYQKMIHKRVNACCTKSKMLLFCREWDSFICDEIGKRAFYQVQELFPGNESLKDCLEKKSLSLPELMTHARMMVFALSFLHGAGVVHADLKPDNLLVVKNKGQIHTRLKIIDFDASLIRGELSPRHKLSPNPGKFRYRGTEGYLSPEHFTGKVPGPESDMFTVGIILCEMLSPDGHPFPYSHEEYRKAVKDGKCNFRRLRFAAPASTINAIRACFEMNPANRPTANQLLSVLPTPNQL